MDSLLHQCLLLLGSVGGRLLSSSSLTLIGMICVLFGLVYVAGAVHEIWAVPRFVEMMATVISVGLTFAIARGVGAEGGMVGAGVGLVFGLGLGAGLEFPISSDKWERTWFGKIQIVYGTVMRAVIAIGGFLPLTVLSLVIGLLLLLCLLLLLAVLALPGWLVFETMMTLGYLVYRLLRALERRLAVIVNWLSRTTVGTPDAAETSALFLFRRMLPSSPVLRWLFAAMMGFYVYLITLTLGHLASIVVASLLPPALTNPNEYMDAFAKAPAVAFLLGTTILIVDMFMWFVTPHRKDDIAWQDMMKDMEWLADDVGDISDGGSRSVAAIEDIGRSLIDPNTHETKWVSEQQRRTLRREYLRSAMFIPFISFAIGLLSGLELSRSLNGSAPLRLDSLGHLVVSLSHIAISETPAILQHAVIFLGAYLLNRIAIRFSTPLLAALGILLFLLGAALQLLQFGFITDMLLTLPFR